MHRWLAEWLAFMWTAVQRQLKCQQREGRMGSHVKVVSVRNIEIRNSADFPFLPFIAVTTKVCF